MRCGAGETAGSRRGGRSTRPGCRGHQSLRSRIRVRRGPGLLEHQRRAAAGGLDVLHEVGLVDSCQMPVRSARASSSVSVGVAVEVRGRVGEGGAAAARGSGRRTSGDVGRRRRRRRPRSRRSRDTATAAAGRRPGARGCSTFRPSTIRMSGRRTDDRLAGHDVVGQVRVDRRVDLGRPDLTRARKREQRPPVVGLREALAVAAGRARSARRWAAGSRRW